jgi:hypothetical protein
MTAARVPGVAFLIAGHGPSAMPRSLSFLIDRWPARDTAARLGYLRIALIGGLHLTAIILLNFNGGDLLESLVFALTWGFLNFFWIVVLRRPLVSAALSLAMITMIMLVSQLKYNIVWMTANFLDVWIVNADSLHYLLSIKPDLHRDVLIGGAVFVLVIGLFWWIDHFRVRRSAALAGFAACFIGLSSVSLAFPMLEWEAFVGTAHVSKFVRSGVVAISEVLRNGYLDSAQSVTERLTPAPTAACVPSGKPPHIILIHDESSFDLRAAPGVRVPAGYGEHFQSFDGKFRHFIAEGTGGPSWFTEYNVLSGLAARSFGRLSYYVTHIAAGRVERGLPKALQRCGYRTFSIYPASGAFMSAKAFQTTAGVDKFVDQRALGTDRIEPDRFYYDASLRMIEREHGRGPMFLFVYLAQNHYPWNYRWRPDLLPEWKAPGNDSIVDEYLRRQELSFRDYAELLGRLERDFPGESFLLVRYGDHQPDFAVSLLEPSLGDDERAKRLLSHDPRYYSTYYAIDTVNFRPANLSSALDTIEGPYLPLIVQEAAGLPLDPSFAEQKRILERCNGLFYGCADGAEARRFNRLLIDAGLIKGL